MKTIQEAAAEITKTDTANVDTNTSSTENNTNTNTSTNDISSEDIISRVNSAKTIESNSEADNTSDTDTKFNVNDIDKIEDPSAKEYAQKAYKSLERGYQKKYQELADERRALDAEKAKLGKFTPERVRDMLSNQEFINAAEQILQSSNPTDGEMSDEQWSALSDSEKSEIRSMKQELLNMKRENELSKFKAELDKQNSELSQKYANYDANKVNQLRNDMMQGKIRATNEHLWKVINYEDAIKAAYKMGKEDRKLEINDKVNASTTSISTTSQTHSTETKPREGESSKDFLMRKLAEKWNKADNKK